MIKMKALCSFGVFGANEGKVRRGREFSAASEHRARDLEALGLAYRVDIKPMPEIQNRMIPESNMAASAGPLDSAGGTIGAEAPAPSSPAAPQRRRRRSSNSAADLLS